VRRLGRGSAIAVVSTLALLAGALMPVVCGNAGPTRSVTPFTKHPTPVWGGQWVAGDPSVVRASESRLLMYFTGVILDLERDTDHQVVIGVAESVDGITWDFAQPLVGDNDESVAYRGDPHGWDRVVETAFVTRAADGPFRMYYTGYRVGYDGPDPPLVAAGAIGYAESMDGLSFERATHHVPVLEPGAPNDEDALFSPTVAVLDDLHAMVYTGWCLACSGEVQGFALLGATSVDGARWTKTNQVVLDGADVPWGANALEAELVRRPGGGFYLFFTSDLVDDETRSAIGVARSQHPFGPWDVHPDPVIASSADWEGTGPIAPTVLIEDDTIRLWYMAPLDAEFSGFSVGYASAAYPLEW